MPDDIEDLDLNESEEDSVVVPPISLAEAKIEALKVKGCRGATFIKQSYLFGDKDNFHYEIGDDNDSAEDSNGIEEHIGFALDLSPSCYWKYLPLSDKWEIVETAETITDEATYLFLGGNNTVAFAEDSTSGDMSNSETIKLSGYESLINLGRLYSHNPGKIVTRLQERSLDEIFDEIYIYVVRDGVNWKSSHPIHMQKPIPTQESQYPSGTPVGADSGWLPLLKYLKQSGRVQVYKSESACDGHIGKMVLGDIKNVLVDPDSIIFQPINREFVYLEHTLGVYYNQKADFKALSRGVNKVSFFSDPILYAINKDFSADYIAMLLNVTPNRNLVHTLIAQLVGGNKAESLKNIKFKVPQKLAQTRDWVEVQYSKRNLRNMADDMCTLDRERIELQSRRLQIANSYLIKSALAVDEDLAEHEANIRPLPYFIERFISTYRHSTEERIVRSGSLLETLFKQVSLIALEEIMADARLDIKEIIPESLRAKILVDPAAGTWRDILVLVKDYKMAELPFCRPLIESLFDCECIDSIVTVRNRGVHIQNNPDDFDIALVPDALSRYLVPTIAALRRAYEGSQILLYTGVERPAKGCIQLKGKSINSASASFKPIKLKVPISICENLEVGDLVCLTPDCNYSFTLKTFFMPRQTAQVSGDILVYNKGFLSAKSEWYGVGAGTKIELTAAKNPFE